MRDEEKREERRGEEEKEKKSNAGWRSRTRIMRPKIRIPDRTEKGGSGKTIQFQASRRHSVCLAKRAVSTFQVFRFLPPPTPLGFALLRVCLVVISAGAGRESLTLAFSSSSSSSTSSSSSWFCVGDASSVPGMSSSLSSSSGVPDPCGVSRGSSAS